MTGVRERGLTLIELLVTLSIAGILLAIAMPNFSKMLGSNRAQIQSELLYHALNYARAEAVRSSARVYVASTSTTTDWAAGWQIWADKPGGTANTYDSGEEIQVQTALAAGTTLTGSSNQISFEPTGFITGAGTTFSTNTATFSYAKGGRFYCITVVYTGRVSLRGTDDNTCADQR